MDETIRILLLEDNPVDVEMIEFELQEAGIRFTLKWVMNEKDFIDAIKNYSPHVILSDYDLPQYNGALALAEAKTFCPSIPFILVTGALDEERAIDMLTSGAKDYVMKNRLHRLAPAVRRVLEEAQEIRERHAAQIELLEAYKTLESKIKKRTAKLLKEIKERKKTEAELKHVASFPILNPNPVFEINSKGRIIYINPAAQRLFPDLEERGSGHPLLAECTDSWTFQKQNETQCEREVLIDGKWYLLTFGSAADTKSIVVYGSDITASKTVQQELQDSRKRISTILNSITNTYIAFDRRWRVVDLNMEMERLLGMAKEKLMGKVLWKVFPDMPMREFTRKLQKAMDDNTSVHFEAEFILDRWYETHAYPSAKGLVVYMRDITLRKNEGSAQRIEEYYGTAADAISDAAIAADI